MATYKGINGFAVQSVASDPSPLDEGQVWYNNATYAFKLASLSTVGTWAAGGNLNTARNSPGGSGTQTAALAFGGGISTPPYETAATESYNGSAWTAVTSLPSTNYQGAGFGTQTAAISIGGSAPSKLTFSWNGTTWTAGNAMNTAHATFAAAGIQTAAVAFGGSAAITATELWNGTSWTSNPTGLNTARRALGGAGTQTAALGFGGYAGGATGVTEEYDASFSYLPFWKTP